MTPNRYRKTPGGFTSGDNGIGYRPRLSRKTSRVSSRMSSRKSSFSSEPDLGLDDLTIGEKMAFWSKESTLHRIIVGIDFGTTYTGISWVETSGSHLKSLGDVHVVRDWPGPSRDTDFAWKTPSRIAYGKENGTQEDSWGFGVKPSMKGYTWMKLLLDPKQATKFDDPSLTASEGQGVLRTPRGKTAVDVCGDYLAKVAVFAHDALKHTISPEILALSPLEFWFTVPAVWSDPAKADTLRAAEKAAMSAHIFKDTTVSTFLIAEPEAAAVATISALTEGGARQQIKTGDGILVCDCGGGTVDITTYQVTAFEPKLEFREILVGTGGKCGSTYIDRLFIRWMEQKFGEAYTSVAWEKRGPASRFMKDFEGHKRDFGKPANSSAYYEMSLAMRAPDSEHYNGEETMVMLYENEMKQLFDPVVNMIVELIRGQLDAEFREMGANTIKTIILVGGFGDSKYLNNVIRKWCGENKPGIRVICPDHPQAAIVRGAALSGLHNLQPSSRRARRYYGFAINPRFDKRRHKPSTKYVSSWDDLDYAQGYMTWSLLKGDVVTEKTKMSHSCHRTLHMDELGDRKFKSHVYCCDLDTAPAHNEDPGVRHLATIETDLTGLDLSAFQQKTKHGRRLCQLDLDLQVQFGSRRGVLCFVSVIKGKETGSVSVSFDGENSTDGNLGLHNENEGGTSCVIQ